MPPTKPSTVTTKDDKVFLRSRDDWSDWFIELARVAEQQAVWQFIDPDASGPNLTEPQPRTVESTLTEIHQTAQAGYAAALQLWIDAGSEGTQPVAPAR